MHALHLSCALGAFVAGVMLAESPYRHELESDIEPFRSILLGLFFMSVGMLLDLRVIAGEPLLVVGPGRGGDRAQGGGALPDRAGLRELPGGPRPCPCCCSQAGEFGFVLFASAASGRLISTEQASLLGAVVTASMVATPFLMRFIGWLQARQPHKHVDLDGPEFSPETNAIVVGYGRFGQTVAQMLMAKRIPGHADRRQGRADRAGASVRTKVYYGDGTRTDLLRIAGADEAEGIFFCHDDPGFSASSWK
jgi:hypothetical protein